MQYRALGPIKNNGRRFAAGEILDLTEADAAPLLEIQAVEPVHKPFTGQIKAPGEIAQ